MSDPAGPEIVKACVSVPGWNVVGWPVPAFPATVTLFWAPDGMSTGDPFGLTYPKVASNVEPWSVMHVTERAIACGAGAALHLSATSAVAVAVRVSSVVRVQVRAVPLGIPLTVNSPPPAWNVEGGSPNVGGLSELFGPTGIVAASAAE